MIKSTVSEMNRVVKPTGYCYAYFGSGPGGISDTYVTPALRKAYQEVPQFRDFIDNLDVSSLRQELRSIFSKGLGNDPFINDESIEFIESLITLDTTTFFQNIIQVPVQLGTIYDSAGIEDMLKTFNGINIKSIPQDHYYDRKDFRRFLTPFHVSRGISNYSKMMFGDWHIHRSWQVSK